MTVGRAHILIYDQTRDLRKQFRCIPNIKRLTEKDLLFWFDLCGWRLTEDHSLKMVYTRQKARAGANPEYSPRIQHEINIREVQTPSKTVFTPEKN